MSEARSMWTKSTGLGARGCGVGALMWLPRRRPRGTDAGVAPRWRARGTATSAQRRWCSGDGLAGVPRCGEVRGWHHQREGGPLSQFKPPLRFDFLLGHDHLEVF